jgi:hypothetical protein
MQVTYNKYKSRVLLKPGQKVLKSTGQIHFVGENKKKRVFEITYFRSEIVYQILTQQRVNVKQMAEVAKIAYGWFERVIEPRDAQNP